MSTLRVSNIEAKADVSSPTVDEKIKFTNSSGDVLFHLDGKTSGITTVGINTTGNTFTVNNTTGDISFSGSVTSSGVSTFTSDVSIADKIVHIGDTDTAIRFPAADTITAETGGTERLRITSSGNVGIGTNLPDSNTKLDIWSNAATWARVTTTDNTSFGAIWVGDRSKDKYLIGYGDSNTTYTDALALKNLNGPIQFHTDNSGQDVERVRISSTGLVGIGTTNPSDKLSVYGGPISVFNTSTHNRVFQAGTTNGHGLMKVFRSDTEVFLRVDSDARRVGIGTDTLRSTFHVYDTSPTIKIQSTTNAFESGRIRFTEENSFLGTYIHYDGSVATGGVLNFGVHNTNDSTVGNDVNILTIDRGTQNVGIHTTIPNARLEITSTGECQVSIIADSNNDGITSDAILNFTRDSNSISSANVSTRLKDDQSENAFIIERSGAERLRIRESGSFTAHLNGAAGYAYFELRGSGTEEPHATLDFTNADTNNYNNAYKINFWEGNYDPSNPNNANAYIKYDAGTTHGGNGSVIIGGYLDSPYSGADQTIAAFARDRSMTLLGGVLRIKTTYTTGSSYPGGTTNTGLRGAVFNFDNESAGQSGLAVGSAVEPFIANRIGTDGILIRLRQDGNTEGDISVSGGTISYNPFMGSHKARLSDNTKPDIPVGTVIECVDELIDWKYASFSVGVGTEAVTKYIPYYGSSNEGEADTITYESDFYTATINNYRETLPEKTKHVCVKVSDTAESKAVFGIFYEWINDIALDRENSNLEYAWNDMRVAAVGNYFIRMQAGQTPEIGDYVESAGDGTARVQSDDILRSKTIAKITSTIPQVTYEDNSFLVTCTLHCG